MKYAVIIFHKNVHHYPLNWIGKCVHSMKNQTCSKGDFFEIDYGNDNIQIYSGSNFESKELKNHAEAHNYLLDKVFDLGYDCAFNVNIDDYYALNRFEKQLPYIEKGYDVVSSNFFNIDEEGNVLQGMKMNDKDLQEESRKNHNIIAHPVLCYSRKFWTSCTRLNPNEIPVDDFKLWKRSIDKYKFVTLPDYLLYYRVHDNKISKSQCGSIVNNIVSK